MPKKELIGAQEAWQAVCAAAPVAPVETLLLEKAAGRVLRSPVVADRPFPPFDRITMDGIALAYEAFAKGRRTFKVAHMAMAGAPPVALTDADACVEVMTGAPLPPGTDTVIRYEDLHFPEPQTAVVKPQATVQPFQNVHKKGSDASAGKELLSSGTRLDAQHIAVAAACGYQTLQTSQLPAVAVIGTGDELVPVAATPLPHQIRQSNAHMLAAALASYHIRADIFHLPDEPQVMRAHLQDCMQKYNLLILSGGVSAGKADYIPALLAQTGADIIFHGVRQKPGKPLLFARTDSGTTIFALPGNPVSAFMCFRRYVAAWLGKYLQTADEPQHYARLTAEVKFDPPLTYFLQVRAFTDTDGICYAEPIVGGGSGDFVNLLSVNGFLILPPDKAEFKRGEIYPLLPFRLG